MHAFITLTFDLYSDTVYNNKVNAKCLERVVRSQLALLAQGRRHLSFHLLLDHFILCAPQPRTFSSSFPYNY